MRIIRSITVVTAVAMSSVVLAACGGSSGDGAATSASDPDEARLAWAQCMRENGVDIPDPTPGGGPTQITGTSPGSMETMEKAEEACSDLREAAMPDLSPEQQTELQDQALAFARCMREQGIDMPDPDVSGGGIRMTLKPGEGGDKGAGGPGSPAFDLAQQACAEFQPKPPAE
jgi:hypothetical protein